MANVEVGQRAPIFELPDGHGYPWDLSGQAESGPVMLVFFRGDWCPYCNGQLASFARNIDEFQRRGVQLAGVSVDSSDRSAELVNKLLLPFPLLSDARGEVARAYGLWNDREGVAVPAIVVVDGSDEVRYLYEGTDFADRPTDEELYAALDGVRNPSTDRVEITAPSIRVTATEAHETVRPDRPAMSLDDLVPYYRGVYFTNAALKRRFDNMGWRGRKALRAVTRHAGITGGYAKAIGQTVELKNS